MNNENSNFETEPITINLKNYNTTQDLINTITTEISRTLIIPHQSEIKICDIIYHIEELEKRIKKIEKELEKIHNLKLEKDW